MLDDGDGLFVIKICNDQRQQHLRTHRHPNKSVHCYHLFGELTQRAALSKDKP